MTAPVWGIPWHGLVRNGQLTLHDGSKKSYPQPANQNGPVSNPIPKLRGMAHKVSVAGVPAVVRSASEQQQDTALGRVWRNVATLSGGHQELAGRALNGWIYIDPNGAKWLVSCPQLRPDFGSVTVFEFSLSRFGLLGAAAEVYTYSIQKDPLMSLSNPSLLSVKPDGSAALFYSGAVESDGFTASQFPEVTISGPGSAATITVALRIPYDEANPVRQETSTSLYQRQAMTAWYAADGSVVRLDAEVSLALAVSSPTSDVPPEEMWGYDTVTSSAIGTISLKANGVEVVSLPVNIATECVEQHDSGYFTVNLSSWSYTVSVGGFTATRSGGEVQDERRFTYQILTGLGFGSAGTTYMLTAGNHPNLPGESFQVSVHPFQYSLQVIGLRQRDTVGASTSYTAIQPATPAGQSSGAPKAISSLDAMPYGAWDPITQESVWAEEFPVCYV